jgi:hypothetical protein
MKLKEEYVENISKLIIFDDVLNDSNWKNNDKELSELLFNGRHYHFSIIVTMQYAQKIPPEKRNNFDVIFLFKEDFIDNKKRLYDHYAGMFPDFNTFQHVFDELTKNYECMVIDCRKHSQNMLNYVFRYKCDLSV